MKSRSSFHYSTFLGRIALWAGVGLAAISTFKMSRASELTGEDLPDAPSAQLIRNLIMVKMPSFELRLKPEANIGNKDVLVTQVSYNPSLTTSAADLILSVQSYQRAYDDAVSAVASGNPDQAWTNLIASTKKDCPSLTTNGMVGLLSLYGNNLWQNYNYKMPWSPTPLNSVAESLVKYDKNAGVCRDIHTALAEIAGACGLKDVGAMFINWQAGNGGVEDPHSPAYYRDPKTGQFIIINYASSFNTGTKYLPQAADIAGQQLSPTTMAAYTETNIGTSQSSMHEILTSRGQAILGSVDHAANLSEARPTVEISVGTLNISASAQAHHAAGDGFTVGVYAAGDDNRETGAMFGSAGGMISKDAHIDVSDKVDFNSTSQMTLGVFDIHDKDFYDQTRNAFEGIVMLKTENSLGWHTEHAPGSLKATLQQTDNYTDHMIGVPYNFLSLKLVTNPTQYAQVHGQITEIITTKTIQNTAFTLRPADDSAGVDLQKKIKSAALDSDTTIHLLGGAGHGVIGEEEKSKVIFKTRAGSVGTGASLFVVQNRSSDYFYTVPVYCRAKIEYDKTIKGIDIQAAADYRCNHDQQLSIPGEQPLGTGEEWNIYKPRATVGLTISWGNKGKTVEN